MSASAPCLASAAIAPGITGAAQPAHRRATHALRPDRVVVINDDCVPSGGAASIALAAIGALRARNMPVTLLTGDSSINTDLESQQVDVVRLGGQHLLAGPRTRAALRGLYDRHTYGNITRWIAANDTPRTVYHLHNWHKYLSPSVFRALRRVEPRLVFSQHDFFLACPNGGYYDYESARPCEARPFGASCLSTGCDKRSSVHKAWRLLRHAVRSRFIDVSRTAAAIVVVHDGMIPLLVRGGIARERIRVLRNPSSAWCAERVHAELNRNVLFVGRLDVDKGVDLLADAAMRSGTRVHVVGNGPLRCALEKKSGMHVEIMGQLDHARIADLARGARCVVVPTKVRETFGLVVMEAAASGLPVVISDTALIASELKAAGAGLVFRSGDADSLATALKRIIDDDELAAKLSKASYAFARSTALTVEDWTDALLEIYGEQLAAVR